MKAYRSPVFGRLFWGAFMTSIFVLASVAVVAKGALTVADLVALGGAAGLLSWLLPARARDQAQDQVDDRSPATHAADER